MHTVDRMLHSQKCFFEGCGSSVGPDDVIDLLLDYTTIKFWMYSFTLLLMYKPHHTHSQSSSATIKITPTPIHSLASMIVPYRERKMK